MLKAGRYTSKGGYQVRIDKDIAAHGLGVAWKGEETRYVCYLANGEFAFKDEDCHQTPRINAGLVPSLQPEY